MRLSMHTHQAICHPHHRSDRYPPHCSDRRSIDHPVTGSWWIISIQRGWSWFQSLYLNNVLRTFRCMAIGEWWIDNSMSRLYYIIKIDKQSTSVYLKIDKVEENPLTIDWPLAIEFVTQWVYYDEVCKQLSMLLPLLVFMIIIICCVLSVCQCVSVCHVICLD